MSESTLVCLARVDELRQSTTRTQATAAFIVRLFELAADIARLEARLAREEHHLQTPVLTELFELVERSDTPVIVADVVTEIDELVRRLRLPSWQPDSVGSATAEKLLWRVLAKYKLARVPGLRENACAYIRHYLPSSGPSRTCATMRKPTAPTQRQ